MTDNLHKKLEDILLTRTMGSWMHNGDNEFVPVRWEDSPLLSQFVGEIKQAFVDDGWHEKHDLVPGVSYVPLMTGQAWYDKFEKELTRLRMEPGYAEKEGIQDTDWYYTATYKHAAKKAAGIE